MNTIETKSYDFVTISINWDFTLKKKNGDIVECDRSWKKDNPQIEER